VTKYTAIAILFLISLAFVPSARAQDVTPLRVRLSPAAASRVVIKRLPPECPDEAKKQHIQGTVVLKVNIDQHGNLISAEAIGGPPALAQAAIDAVKKWTYRPFMLNGEPVQAETQVDVKFTLPK